MSILLRKVLMQAAFFLVQIRKIYTVFRILLFEMKQKKILFILLPICLILTLLFGIRLGIKLSFPRPYRDVVRSFGVDENLVYAVMKAESGFRTDAISSAGAVGLMQIKPSTAQFICDLNGLEFQADRLQQGDYNTELGCRYLQYLMERFDVCETAVAAYNAGEGTVRGWLQKVEYSPDGLTLTSIPYPETANYVKKVIKFRKIYSFFD